MFVTVQKIKEPRLVFIFV